MNPHAHAPSYMLPRICDVIRLCFRCRSAALHTDGPLPDCFRFCSGQADGLPTLQAITTEPAPGGPCLSAQLHIPVCIHYAQTCGSCCFKGTLCIPFSTVLRTPFCPQMQLMPLTDLCIHDVSVQNGCLTAVFDLTTVLYVVRPEPVRLSYSCEPEQADCAPYFNLPLYPELPQRCR